MILEDTQHSCKRGKSTQDLILIIKQVERKTNTKKKINPYMFHKSEKSSLSLCSKNFNITIIWYPSPSYIIKLNYFLRVKISHIARCMMSIYFYSHNINSSQSSTPNSLFYCRNYYFL